MMIQETSFDRFRTTAIEAGLAYDSPRDAYADGHKKFFCLIYNFGNLYVPQDPEAVRKLVMFARRFAVQDGADYYERRDSYGILWMAAPCVNFEERSDFIIFDPLDSGRPEYVSVKMYLYDNGYLIPDYVENPLPIKEVVAHIRATILI